MERSGGLFLFGLGEKTMFLRNFQLRLGCSTEPKKLSSLAPRNSSPFGPHRNSLKTFYFYDDDLIFYRLL